MKENDFFNPGFYSLSETIREKIRISSPYSAPQVQLMEKHQETSCTTIDELSPRPLPTMLYPKNCYITLILSYFFTHRDLQNQAVIVISQEIFIIFNR